MNNKKLKYYNETKNNKMTPKRVRKQFDIYKYLAKIDHEPEGQY